MVFIIFYHLILLCRVVVSPVSLFTLKKKTVREATSSQVMHSLRHDRPARKRYFSLPLSGHESTSTQHGCIITSLFPGHKDSIPYYSPVCHIFIFILYIRLQKISQSDIKILQTFFHTLLGGVKKFHNISHITHHKGPIFVNDLSLVAMKAITSIVALAMAFASVLAHELRGGLVVSLNFILLSHRPLSLPISP